jgi:uncharacterized protein (TIGR02246 family)
MRHGSSTSGHCIASSENTLPRFDTNVTVGVAHSQKEGKVLRLVRYSFVALLMLLPAQVLAGPAEEASVVIDRWAAALNANDADAVVKLYAPDGLLHGTSSPTLNAGTSAISEYFKVLPGSGNKVTIGDRHMVALGDAAAMGVGFYEFKSAQGATRPTRFTFVMIKRGPDWLIAHHHSSVLPPARQ